MVETYSEDGAFWIKFVYTEGEEIIEREKQGTWKCNRDILTITYNTSPERVSKGVSHYRILEIKKTTYMLESIGNGIVYEYFKVIN